MYDVPLVRFSNNEIPQLPSDSLLNGDGDDYLEA